MKAMVLETVKTALKFKELPKPEPEDRALLIRILACAICRTDLHLIDGELSNPTLPIIPGHQIVGIVEKLGSHVRHFEIGDLVGVAWLSRTCGNCFYCNHERENLCDRALFTGYQINGGFAQYCTAQEEFVYALPSRHPAPYLAPLLCAGFIGFRAYKLLQREKKIGFYGFGNSARLLLQVARHEGKEIAVFTRKGDSKSQKRALEMGAVYAGDSEKAPPTILDGALIFASAGELIPLALSHVRKGAQVVCAAIHMSDIPSFPYELLWGERSIHSIAHMKRQDGIEFLALAEQIKIQTEIECYPLEEANRAIEDFRRGVIRRTPVLTMD